MKKDKDPKREFVIHGGDLFNRKVDCLVMIEYLKIGPSFTTEDLSSLRKMIDSSDEENLVLAEIIIKNNFNK